jgi:Co/Zn/Cd efflux system component
MYDVNLPPSSSAKGSSPQISERENSPDALSFGWQRASLLGAFFNGTFLLALGVSIFLQSVERFVSLQRTTPGTIVKPS